MNTHFDPYESYLLKADALFKGGDVVQAGQIWQAILKKNPDHSEARAGLYKVKLHFDARSTQGGLVPPPDDLSPSPAASAPAPEPSVQEEVERLLRDGCMLFDMGQSEDALRKWEKVVELDPGHALAHGYMRDARRDLGLATSADGKVPAPPPAPAPASAPPPIPDRSDESLERLLREGAQLYDMGMPQEAEAKWQAVLDQRPDHRAAREYLAMSQRERQQATAPKPAPQPPPPPAPAPPPPAVPGGERAPNLEARLQKAEELLGRHQLEEAAYLFQQVLTTSPQNLRALQGFRQAQTELAARQAPLLIPKADPPPPPEAPKPILLTPSKPLPPLEEEGVQPPIALQEPAAPARKGLDLPDLLRQVEKEVPSRFKSPKILGLLALALVVIYGSFLGFRAYRKDVRLREAVRLFRTASEAPVSRSLDIAKLTEDPAVIRKEAESFLSDQPLWAYYRAQELIRQNSLDGPAAQIMGQASLAMARVAGAGQGSKAEALRLAAQGNLDGAQAMTFHLLELQPDDPEMRALAARLMLSFAEAYARKERWDDAEDQLKRVQMLYPTDKAWAARLKLLKHIRTMRDQDRQAWVPLLG